MHKYIIQVIMAIIGSVGFAILFHTRGKKLLYIALGGALAWIIYLLSYTRYYDEAISTLLSTIVAATLAETIARMIKTPVISLLVPMLVPLIPGGHFYYTMYSLLFGRMDEGLYYLQLTLVEAGAIACGIIFVAFITQFITKTKNYLRISKN